jgi:hypothetical protein
MPSCNPDFLVRTSDCGEKVVFLPLTEAAKWRLSTLGRQLMPNGELIALPEECEDIFAEIDAKELNTFTLG